MDAAQELSDSNVESWSNLLVTIDLPNALDEAQALIETINSIKELVEMLQSITTSMEDIHKGMGTAEHGRKMHDDRHMQMGMYLQLQELILLRMKAVESAKRTVENPMGIQQLLSDLNVRIVLLISDNKIIRASHAMGMLQQASEHYTICDEEQKNIMRKNAKDIFPLLWLLRVLHPDDQQINLLLNNLDALANTIEIPPEEWTMLKEAEQSKYLTF